MVQSAQHGAVVLGPRGAHHVDERGVRGEDPLARFSPTAAQHLRRTDRFPHVADIMIGRLYDPVLDDGCAFEALISFHGGFGGPQTRAFILAAPGLPLPEAPIVGAEAVHDVLLGWRQMLQASDHDRHRSEPHDPFRLEEQRT